jgi:aminopeptidase-like protein
MEYSRCICKDLGGIKIIDFKRCNLHVMSYSIPVRKRVTLAELKEHLFSLPDLSEWIPYRTSYY